MSPQTSPPQGHAEAVVDRQYEPLVPLAPVLDHRYVDWSGAGHHRQPLASHPGSGMAMHSSLKLAACSLRHAGAAGSGRKIAMICSAGSSGGPVLSCDLPLPCTCPGVDTHSALSALLTRTSPLLRALERRSRTSPGQEHRRGNATNLGLGRLHGGETAETTFL